MTKLDLGCFGPLPAKMNLGTLDRIVHTSLETCVTLFALEASGSAWCFCSIYMTIDALTSRKFHDVLMIWLLSDRAEAS